MERTFIQDKKYAVKRNVFLALVFLLTSTACFSQFNVTEIITDYGGYWKSAATSINSIKPDNSHNLVSFSFKGNRYSTGVNDALLTAKSQSFIAADFRALPVTGTGSAATSNTKIGLGAMYDGVSNGPSSPAPANNIPYYLTDGIKGLDLGTCVANLPAGVLSFPVSSIVTHSIGDGVPDIVITQIADPSGSQDRYEFTDINGKLVGNYVDIVLTNIPPVGNWTADFYEASSNPMTLAGGFTKTDRPIRLWASDLNAFGIDSINAHEIAYFKIILSGNSDVAFVAYNTNAINIINALLPVKLNNFTGDEKDNQVKLSWQTLAEINTAAFVIERSTNGTVFTPIGTLPAAGNTAAALYYSYTDKNPIPGKNYYRLKMVDKDGHTDYSTVITVNRLATATGSIRVYPNPAKNYIMINHPFAGNNESFRVVNLQGNMVVQGKIIASSLQTKIDLPVVPAGMYILIWTNGKEITENTLAIL